MLYEIINPSDAYTLRADKWFVHNFGKTAEEVVTEVLTDNEAALKLADCLDSCLIGEAAVRAESELVSEAGEPAKLARHDRFRSSLNDIGRRAWEMARRLREGKGTRSVIRAPVQAFRG